MIKNEIKHAEKKTTIEFKDLRNNFSILKKCKSKVDCLVLEMFFY